MNYLTHTVCHCLVPDSPVMTLSTVLSVVIEWLQILDGPVAHYLSGAGTYGI
jgi:hypothetical protein